MLRYVRVTCFARLQIFARESLFFTSMRPAPKRTARTACDLEAAQVFACFARFELLGISFRAGSKFRATFARELLR